MIRVGLGYDVHRLVKGRLLVLGGVRIPFDCGLKGHSDADVLVHAVMDAILGALAKGDIGRHFPESDMQYEGISSLVLLGRVVEIMKREGYAVHNLDTVIIAQKPRLSPYIYQMSSNLAEVVGVDVRNISVKATTTEGLDAIGRGEGIAAQAVVSLIEKNFLKNYVKNI